MTWWNVIVNLFCCIKIKTTRKSKKHLISSFFQIAVYNLLSFLGFAQLSLYFECLVYPLNIEEAVPFLF